jgi:pilus assembly protein CpaF
MSVQDQPIATGLEARIASLAARRGPVAKLTMIHTARREPKVPLVPQEKSKETPSPSASELASPERLSGVGVELIDRLSAEISLEQRIILSRRELSKIIGSAVDNYITCQAINTNAIERRNLITNILQALLAPSGNEVASGRLRNRQVENAKTRIQPLILERMDATAAAEMPRPAFEAQLTGWITELLAESKIQLNFAEQRELVELLISDMLGLGPLDPLIADDTVSDIMVNGPKQVYVERRGKLELTNVTFRDHPHLMNTCLKIVNRIGRRVDEMHPHVDARLPDGSRVNVIIPPLAIDGGMISIRKFSKKTLTLDTMAASGSMSPAMATVLKIAARCRLNIVISGGTGSGKTTLLNALSNMIDPTERTITIEDTAELQLQQAHVGRLETRTANLEGNGEVSMRDLLRNALRMRPDRIIIGECRGDEAFDMLQAMNTGHDGSMSTIHANNPRDALSRLENMIGLAAVSLPSRAIRSQIASAVHLVCQVSRMRDGQRRVTQITEIIGMEGDVITSHELFTYKFHGEGRDGRLRGTFVSSGIRPTFLPRAEYFGLDKMLLDAI